MLGRPVVVVDACAVLLDGDGAIGVRDRAPDLVRRAGALRQRDGRPLPVLVALA